jgi:hypothetical protein
MCYPDAATKINDGRQQSSRKRIIIIIRIIIRECGRDRYYVTIYLRCDGDDDYGNDDGDDLTIYYNGDNTHYGLRVYGVNTNNTLIIIRLE